MITSLRRKPQIKDKIKVLIIRPLFSKRVEIDVSQAIAVRILDFMWPDGNQKIIHPEEMGTL